MTFVAIIDSGGANVASVEFALDRLGVASALTADPAVIARATHVVLPGVGAARNAMDSLRTRGLTKALIDLRVPTLGICLGMQLLGEASEEGDTPCLGIAPIVARRIRSETLPVPHMGWNRVRWSAPSPLFEGIESGAHFYFVHSFAQPVSAFTLATSVYAETFSAALARGNFFGVQFHPERSSDAGARLLRNFVGVS